MEVRRTELGRLLDMNPTVSQCSPGLGRPGDSGGVGCCGEVGRLLAGPIIWGSCDRGGFEADAFAAPYLGCSAAVHFSSGRAKATMWPPEGRLLLPPPAEMTTYCLPLML